MAELKYLGLDVCVQRYMLFLAAVCCLNIKLDAMESPGERIARWSQSRCQNVPVAGLLARCPVAHKWKAPFRGMVLRETLFWRMHDLAQQTLLLTEHQHLLGARALLRAGIETLALLIFLNQRMAAVVAGAYSFFDFDALTKQMLLGSRTPGASHTAIHVLKILEKAEKEHPGLQSMYDRLSESVHPNFDGVLYTYSSSDPEKYETSFSNRWVQVFGPEQEPAMSFVYAVFEHEYDKVWSEQFEALEAWLKNNDAELERQKNGI
ncbi:MAG: hypothetical protein ACT4P9_06620 [Betaproteobacteria bacterium]